VNIEGRTDDAQLVLSTGWDNSIVGKYYAGQSEDSVVEDYYQDSSDELFPRDPKGVMAVQIPSNRFEKPHDGSVYAGTILHEAVHNHVAQLPERSREGLYECFRDVSTAEYRGDDWDYSGAVETWAQGWMSRYASKNIHEDVASTTTLVLNERSDDDKNISGPARIPFGRIRGYMDESQRQNGWNRIERKVTCLHEHGVLFDEEYAHVSRAFSGESVAPDYLGYDKDYESVIDTVNSVRPYQGREYPYSKDRFKLLNSW
jgi:hypothetical protein